MSHTTALWRLLLVNAVMNVGSLLVNAAGDEGIEVANVVSSCDQFEALLYDPQVSMISITSEIAVRECSWSKGQIPGRRITIDGGGIGVLDFRGMHEDINLGMGKGVDMSRLSVICDSRDRDIFSIMIGWEETGLTLSHVSLEYTEYSRISGDRPWLMVQLDRHHSANDPCICSLNQNEIMVDELRMFSVKGGTIDFRMTEVHCNDCGDAAYFYFELAPCELEPEEMLHHNIAKALFGLGACVIAAITLACIFCAAKNMLLSRKKSRLERDDTPFLETPRETIALEDVKLGPVIGKGGFSIVYHGTLHGKPVAVKMFENEDMGVSQKEPSEALLSSTITHTNVVKCIAHKTCGWGQFPSGFGSMDGDQDGDFSDVSGAFDFVEMMGQSPQNNCSRTWLIMEYCSLGSISTAIRRGFFCHNHDYSQLKLEALVPAVNDIAVAMEYLHSLGIIHGDLKSQNVLLQESDSDPRGYVCKVGDFGFSRLALNRTHIQTFTCGSVRAMPPEVLKNGILTPAADVYSFGILLWELLQGHPPYKGWGHQTILHNVVRGRRPKLPDTWPKVLSKLIRDCLQQSYWERPSFGTILSRLSEIEIPKPVNPTVRSERQKFSDAGDLFLSCSYSAENSSGSCLPRILDYDQNLWNVKSVGEHPLVYSGHFLKTPPESI